MPDLGRRQAGAVADEDPRFLVERPENARPIEEVVGAAIPEVRVVEHCIHHRRRVARLDAPHVHAPDTEDSVAHGVRLLSGSVGGQAIVSGREHALRGRHVVRIEHNTAPAIVVLLRIRQGMERKVVFLEGIIGAASRTRAGSIELGALGGGHVVEPGTELVLGPIVDEGVEMAGATGLPVAADLHVPEQRLAELRRSLPSSRAGPQEVREIVDLRNFHGRQGREPGRLGRRAHVVRVDPLGQSLRTKADHARHDGPADSRGNGPAWRSLGPVDPAAIANHAEVLMTRPRQERRTGSQSCASSHG